MKLYDTMAREMRELTAEDGESFRFYCCGPTVYGPAHIGNFRTFVLQDVFRRVLQLSGQKTQHVRNITDVDDKTIRDSRAADKSLTEFTEAWTVKFRADCEALNLLAPHDEPSAVAHIPQQVALIEELMEKGHAYQSEDRSVYFKVTSFESYGCLSHLDQRELRAGGSEGSAAVADDEYEKDAVADFALWKARKEEDGENFWPSPWGEGRPGWHLECSAMCREYLGDTFDLHSGGVDLVFPHHENEIAQSEAASGKTFARHWFHITHLMVDGGKMSKSLGNMYTLADLQERGFTANELRYVLISGHYRHPLNFTLQSMADAKKALLRIAKAGQALLQRAGKREQATGEGDCEADILQHDFVYFKSAYQSLLQDLNTPEALGRIFSELRELKVDQLRAEQALEAWSDLKWILLALGLSFPQVEEKAGVEVPAEISELAEQRWQAKQAKEWAQSDALRDKLLEKGWEVKDGKDGYELCPRN
ncbi:MAG: cysteine--tRNA ligase [Verrucomicrobiales bacterium]|nr:cysteine--tRNA ligase [Verrucomicrobiales bacterium]